MNIDEFIARPYDASSIEPKWVENWQKAEIGKPSRNADAPPFCIIAPPPNVTGALHMGHALNNTLQDILVRYHRLKGYNTLWQFGVDHAGIATQSVVERELRKKGLERTEIGRERFIEEVWAWKAKYGDRIVNQLKRLGASCDWSRVRFTMDEQASIAVREVFVQLFNEGMIYRGQYMVNWSPGCMTALSDLEVDMKEIDGQLVEIKYQVANTETYLTVATTRPETMLGDAAIAVHPDDDRYKTLIGQQALIPIVNRPIPIIADDYVDPEYGTGVLKVTPGHDFNDFEIGQRHQLPVYSVIDKHGNVVDDEEVSVAHFAGLDRFEVRKQILNELSSLNQLGEIEPIKHMVGHCYRSGVVVEPMISTQWFVKTKPLAEMVLQSLDDRQTEVIPDQWDKVLREWMHNIKDWCISRQIWWGHQIPVWHCHDCGYDHAQIELELAHCPNCQSSNIEQDPDVLDTWFSSALWPFSTLGWPNDDTDLKTWYPTSVLITAFDIVFFWVARMMMMGLKFQKTVPFEKVLFHALVRDADGVKMSKTRGNVIDPLDLAEQKGADALRFTLCALTTMGRDIKLDPKRIEGYQNFANKVWNAAKYVAKVAPSPSSTTQTQFDHPLNQWIHDKITTALQKIDQDIGQYRFGEYAETIYHCIWDDYCDWYIEASKALLRHPEYQAETQIALRQGLASLLHGLHPIMPFITEEIHQAIYSDQTLISLSSWPVKEAQPQQSDANQAFETIISVVKGIRNIRGENRIPPNQSVSCYVTPTLGERLNDPSWQAIVLDLAKLSEINVTSIADAPKFSGTAMVDSEQVWISLAGIVDIESEILRINKHIQEQQAVVDQSTKKLGNANFVDRAPQAVVDKEKQKLEAANSELQRAQEQLQKLSSVHAEA